MDKHWDSDDVVVLKIDMKNAFNLVYWMSVLLFSPSFCHGLVGATGHTHYCGIL